MDIGPIGTEEDYQVALLEISALMDLDPDVQTPEGERLDVLVTRVQAYEADHYLIEPPDATEAIKFRMDQMGRP
jgi:HTH-type transcriptional regulator/antitoxin HigA